MVMAFQKTIESACHTARPLPFNHLFGLVVQMIHLTTSHRLINIYRCLSMYQGEQNGVTIQKYRHSNKRDGHV